MRLWDLAAGATLAVSVRFGAPITALAAHDRATAIGLDRAVAYLAVADLFAINKPDANTQRR